VCRSISPGACDVAYIRSRTGLQLASDRGHLAVGEGDIGCGIKLLRRIDQAATAQDQVKWHRRLGSRRDLEPDPEK
jgi:hypothetical protein